jgi:steroid delta-isomerase-like uncharacterized protein
MTRDEIVALLTRRAEAFAARDVEALANTHAQHGTVYSPIFTTLRGRAQILESYRSLFRIFPDWTYEPDEPLIDGDRVAVPFTVQATHVGEFMGIEGTGRRFAVQGVQIFTMDHGYIAEDVRIYDFSGLLIQVGILRTKPARP